MEHIPFEQRQTLKILSSFQTEIKPLSFEQRSELFKSQMQKDIDLVLKGFEVLENTLDNDQIFKSEDYQQDVDILCKSLSSAVHKYIQKIGDKYIYDKPSERKIKSINELRDYYNHKNTLDSVHQSLKDAPHSPALREVYKIYNKKSEDFENKYGHKHNSPEADHYHKLVVHGMMNHINNRLNEIDEKQNRHLKDILTPNDKDIQKESMPLVKAKGEGRIISKLGDEIVYDDAEDEQQNDYNDKVDLDATCDEIPEMSVVKSKVKKSDVNAEPDDTGIGEE